MPATRVTIPYGNPAAAKVLVIGHDPRLQTSDSVAQYAFFADYYFKPAPTWGPHKAKYNLAKAVFDYAVWLTSDQCTPDQVLVTNLCNEALPHAPKNRVVYIPESKAFDGIAAIRDLLAQSSVDVIFALSQQVNYWLQALGFCESNPTFLRAAKPSEKGASHDPPYYQPSAPSAFKLVCGKRLMADGQRALYPVVHVKNFPLKGPFVAAYQEPLEICRKSVLDLLAVRQGVLR